MRKKEEQQILKHLENVTETVNNDIGVENVVQIPTEVIDNFQKILIPNGS